MIKILSEIPGTKLFFPEKIQELTAMGVMYEEDVTSAERKDEDLYALTNEYDVIVTCDQHKWTKDIFEQCKRLKFLIRCGKGVDNVDVDAAKENGILVANTGGSNASSVAEQTLALMLSAVHHLFYCDKKVREGDWNHNRKFHELKSSVIGLVGFGAISQHVAEMLQGFCPKEILAYDPYPNEKIGQKYHVRFVSFDELITSSDIISVHVPLTKETTHMFHREVFRKMKKDSIFISISRGAVVDENALYEALLEKRILWAGLDVFEQEPLPSNHKLLTLDNVFCTPHTAAASYDAEIESHRIAANQLLEFVNHEHPQCALW